MESQAQAGMVRLMAACRRLGVSDERVLEAMAGLDRVEFVPEALRDYAYDDGPLPIEVGQTISQPSLVARMTEILDVAPTHRVLEVGTGTAYQTAILSRLAGAVYSVERWASLISLAERRLNHFRCHNVSLRLGDGREGWPEHAPYDRIMVTAAGETVPEALLAQLGAGGIMVIPVGPQDGRQVLRQIVRTSEGVEEHVRGRVRFVPLRTGIAEEER